MRFVPTCVAVDAEFHQLVANSEFSNDFPLRIHARTREPVTIRPLHRQGHQCWRVEESLVDNSERVVGDALPERSGDRQLRLPEGAHLGVTTQSRVQEHHRDHTHERVRARAVASSVLVKRLLVGVRVGDRKPCPVHAEHPQSSPLIERGSRRSPALSALAKKPLDWLWTKFLTSLHYGTWSHRCSGQSERQLVHHVEEGAAVSEPTRFLSSRALRPPTQPRVGRGTSSLLLEEFPLLAPARRRRPSSHSDPLDS